MSEVVAGLGDVLIFDATGAGFSQNLVSFRNALLPLAGHCRIDYHFCNLGRWKGERLGRVKAEACVAISKADMVVCATDSMRGFDVREDQHTVLLCPPRQKFVDGRKLEAMEDSPYTHVIVQSDAFSDGARSVYGGEVVASGLPAVDSLVSSESRIQATSRLYDYCPQAEGRTVIVLLSHYPARKLFAGLDLDDLLGRLTEQHFVVAAVPGLRDMLTDHPACWADHLFEAQGCFKHFELLGMADTLITTRFTDGLYFSATGRRFLALKPEWDKSANLFEGLSFGSLADLPDILQGDQGDSLESFRSRYLGPNVCSNSERAVQAVGFCSTRLE
ncbi:MAG: hypothetical protein JXE06_06900 [Coriobacteriia bacterium]|nr:hypothetical protein [Coriobacteriia bacterium]MBN2822847.1 hypothetical protein [Coriobacteriia bacterium]